MQHDLNTQALRLCVVHSYAARRRRNFLVRSVGSDLQSYWFAGIPAKCVVTVGMCPGLPLSAAEGVAPRG